jgi:signal transduction histidine kinase
VSAAGGLVYRSGMGGKAGPAARDAYLVIGAAATALVGALIAPASARALDAFGYALLLTGAVALGARRRAPVAVVLVTTVCVSGYLVLGYPGAAAAFPVLVAIYTAVRAGRHRVALVPLGALAAVMVVDLVAGLPVRQVIEDRFLLAGWLVAAAVIAEAFRQWQAYVREAEERAADAERTREEVARRRAVEERLRIARELHDSLTHSISVIKVQAGVAIHLARKRGEQVPDALLAIQEASRDAVRELRATLDVLRQDDGEPGSGLDRLPELVDRARAAGVPATVTVSGTPRELPVDVDLAAYRIVQEALTNIARHAGAASASVHVAYGLETLTVQVDDDGKGVRATVPVPGNGLTGMRERVTALGGRLRAEPRPEGGFTVQAALPVPDPA